MKVRVSFPFDATTLIVPLTGSFRAGPNDSGRLFAVAREKDDGPRRKVDVR
jgi:hypothetical protein